MSYPDLAGKAAIVTGAGAGIGLAVARRLATEGCQVVCADIDGAAADTAAAEIGSGAVGYRVDVSREEQVVGMVEACTAAFGGVDNWSPMPVSFIWLRSSTPPSRTSIVSSGSTCAAHGCAPSMRRRR